MSKLETMLAITLLLLPVLLCLTVASIAIAIINGWGLPFNATIIAVTVPLVLTTVIILCIALFLLVTIIINYVLDRLRSRLRRRR